MMSTEIDKRKADVSKGFVWKENGEVTFLACEPLERAGFVNAFSSRHGGVSPLPENSLNLSLREDKKENVEENRRRFFSATNLSSYELMTAHQIHSEKGVLVSSPADVKGPEPDCDSLVASLERVLLGIQTADCLPVLIGDPKKGTMAAIHAGWRGTMARITERTVTELMRSSGTKPETCWVAMGPSACGDCYEVGADVVQTFRTQFPESISFFKDIKENGKAFLNVQAANFRQLLSVGVPETQIFASSFCTIHDNDLFFSHRVESKGGAVPVGRQLSVIGRK